MKDEGEVREMIEVEKFWGVWDVDFARFEAGLGWTNVDDRSKENTTS